MNKHTEKIKELESEVREKDRQIGILQKERTETFKERNIYWGKIVKKQQTIIQGIKEEMMDMAKKFRESEIISQQKLQEFTNKE